MGKCKHHPQSASGGLCSSCLEKKLNSVWRGESQRPDPAVAASLHPKEAIAVLGSIASITKRTHSSKQAVLPKGRDITEAGMDFVLDSRYADRVRPFVRLGDHGNVKRRLSKVSGSVSKKVVGGRSDGKVNAFPGVQTMGCRSLPLVDRIATETALRVIREVGEDDGEDRLSEGDEIVLHMKDQDPRVTCFSPSRWQSKLRSKWGLGSPMTGNNKVFPSKSVEHVQKAHPPLREDSRFGDVDPSPQLKAPTLSKLDSGVVIEGMPDRILKPEDMNQQLRNSYVTVLKWLQDLPMPETSLLEIGDGVDSCLVMRETGNSDLARVGHLHQIAEEYENLDESSVEEVASGNHLGDVASFGKFLIRAAQRRPKQGLSRVASAR